MCVHNTVATQVTCLGVIFDCELTFSKQVTSVVRRCFYHLRQIRAVRKSLTTESVKMLVHARIASRLDYCNSVFISSVQLIYKLCTQCWTQVHVSSCESGNTTTSHQHYATFYTGCLFVNEYCTRWAPLFTSVFMGQLHLIWRIYVFQSLPILVIVIFAQQRMETYRCLEQERWPMDHEVLLFQVLLSETLCHRPLHLDSFRVD